MPPGIKGDPPKADPTPPKTDPSTTPPPKTDPSPTASGGPSQDPSLITGALAGGTNGLLNAGMITEAQANAASDMAATLAIAAIARQVALVEAMAALIKKGGDAISRGI